MSAPRRGFELAVVRSPHTGVVHKLEVEEGATVTRRQMLMWISVKRSGGGGEDKLRRVLADRDGQVVRLKCEVGDSVEQDETVLFELEYCPHDVMYEGVCVVCGEEVDEST